MLKNLTKLTIFNPMAFSKPLLSFLTIFSLLINLFPLNLFSPETALANPSGWLSGYSYRKAINIDNTQNSSALTNYQVSVDTTQAIYNETGLVGSWHMNESSGTVASDMSGNSNNGILTNGPTWTTGKFGSALSFDGTDDYVDINDFQLGGEITVEGWIYPKSHQNWQRLLDFGNGPASDNIVFAASQGTTGQPLLDVYVGSTYYRASSSDPITLNSWHHLVGVLGGKKVKLYVDNVLKADVTGPAGLNNLIRTNNFIGKSNWSADSYFNGSIDEVRISNVARSAAWIKATYYSLNNSLLTYGAEETYASSSSSLSFSATLSEYPLPFMALQATLETQPKHNATALQAKLETYIWRKERSTPSQNWIKEETHE